MPWLGARWRLHRRFQRKFSAYVNSTANVDHKSVTLTDGGGQKAHLWVEFTRIYESRRVVVLEEGGEDFIFLPKTAMSEAQLVEFKRLAMAATLDCSVTIASA
ncbi:MAG: YcxB family protein [Candidatus Acidiferrales bacterium]